MLVLQGTKAQHFFPETAFGGKVGTWLGEMSNPRVWKMDFFSRLGAPDKENF